MKKSIQGVETIAPMPDNNKEKKATDPIQEDYDKGKEALENNDLPQAAVFFHNALLGHEEKGDQNGVANACNQLGNVCLQRKEYGQALTNYQRAWDICEKESDAMSLLALQKQFVLVYCGLKQYDKAVDSCLGLLDQYSGNNDPGNGVAILEQLADIYVEQGEQSKAADSYKMIASIHTSFDHKNIAEKFQEKAEKLMTHS